MQYPVHPQPLSKTTPPWMLPRERVSPHPYNSDFQSMKSSTLPLPMRYSGSLPNPLLLDRSNSLSSRSDTSLTSESSIVSNQSLYTYDASKQPKKKILKHSWEPKTKKKKNVHWSNDNFLLIHEIEDDEISICSSDASWIPPVNPYHFASNRLVRWRDDDGQELLLQPPWVNDDNSSTSSFQSDLSNSPVPPYFPYPAAANHNHFSPLHQKFRDEEMLMVNLARSASPIMSHPPPRFPDDESSDICSESSSEGSFEIASRIKVLNSKANISKESPRPPHTSPLHTSPLHSSPLKTSTEERLPPPSRNLPNGHLKADQLQGSIPLSPVKMDDNEPSLMEESNLEMQREMGFKFPTPIHQKESKSNDQLRNSGNGEAESSSQEDAEEVPVRIDSKLATAVMQRDEEQKEKIKAARRKRQSLELAETIYISGLAKLNETQPSHSEPKERTEQVDPENTEDKLTFSDVVVAPPLPPVPSAGKQVRRASTGNLHQIKKNKKKQSASLFSRLTKGKNKNRARNDPLPGVPLLDAPYAFFPETHLYAQVDNETRQAMLRARMEYEKQANASSPISPYASIEEARLALINGQGNLSFGNTESLNQSHMLVPTSQSSDVSSMPQLPQLEPENVQQFGLPPSTSKEPHSSPKDNVTSILSTEMTHTKSGFKLTTKPVPHTTHSADIPISNPHFGTPQIVHYETIGPEIVSGIASKLTAHSLPNPAGSQESDTQSAKPDTSTVQNEKSHSSQVMYERQAIEPLIGSESRQTTVVKSETVRPNGFVKGIASKLSGTLQFQEKENFKGRKKPGDDLSPPSLDSHKNTSSSSSKTFTKGLPAQREPVTNVASRIETVHSVAIEKPVSGTVKSLPPKQPLPTDHHNGLADQTKSVVVDTSADNTVTATLNVERSHQAVTATATRSPIAPKLASKQKPMVLPKPAVPPRMKSKVENQSKPTPPPPPQKKDPVKVLPPVPERLSSLIRQKHQSTAAQKEGQTQPLPPSTSRILATPLLHSSSSNPTTQSAVLAQTVSVSTASKRGTNEPTALQAREMGKVLTKPPSSTRPQVVKGKPKINTEKKEKGANVTVPASHSSKEKPISSKLTKAQSPKTDDSLYDKLSDFWDIPLKAQQSYPSQSLPAPATTTTTTTLSTASNSNNASDDHVKKYEVEGLYDTLHSVSSVSPSVLSVNIDTSSLENEVFSPKVSPAPPADTVTMSTDMKVGQDGKMATKQGMSSTVSSNQRTTSPPSTVKSPLSANKPALAQKPPLSAQKPALAQKPPLSAQKPSTLAQKPPLSAQESSTLAQKPPSPVQEGYSSSVKTELVEPKSQIKEQSGSKFLRKMMAETTSAVPHHLLILEQDKETEVRPPVKNQTVQPTELDMDAKLAELISQLEEESIAGTLPRLSHQDTMLKKDPPNPGTYVRTYGWVYILIISH